ncbi:DUF1295 domain-containing protein [Emticicia sp. 17c]|uniref:DUF1295 domain-containing protein n=1 Tax=Emticicia sp. 17c TaxID=3127704 RepID=UPI00301DBFEC
MARVILLLVIILISIFLFYQPFPFGEGFLIIMSCLTVLWLVSLFLKDASIIDIFWGSGFVITVWYYKISLSLTDTRSLLFCVLVSIWGLRLSLHLAFRNIGKGEDYRYQEWRQQHANNWWWVSFFRVFVLQGVLLWLISAIYAPAMQSSNDTLALTDYIGIVIWSIGFIFEAVGDWQLQQFRKNPANKGQVMQTGLWSLTRHPNYFGDAMQWWGYGMFSITTGNFIYLFSPLLMTFLLMQVSGVALLEKKLTETKPQYAHYIRRVPAFFPKIF